ncbi:MAG: tRNA (adenosine(37)-N6)-threonylcarbamoyltransferase complex ATPase subunit type 1 TsaE [Gemmatimonadaceae bacterium]|nr:tRNA (adenosine(37)-N6)-threonylcarbamoyltransferase complex ATPase subunit type 1 TsaE [Gemmatimonadaceae bacterium]
MAHADADAATHGVREAVLDEPALRARGEAIGAALPVPALVTLRGDLGAGKTTLVQAIARGLGVDEAVTSPTFALVHEYAGTRAARVVHCDLYRLRGVQEAATLGLDDLLAEPDVVVLVEWPERAGPLLDGPTLAIELAHVPGGPAQRRLVERWGA